jgi:hypothetical protein
MSVSPQRRGRGKAKKSLEIIGAAHRILSEINPASVRAVCYKLFNEKLIPNMSKGQTDRVGRLLTSAREDGLIPWEWIVDGTREIDRVASWSNPDALLRAAAEQYRMSRWDQQAVRVLLCSEKSTIAGTVKPITDKFQVGFLSLHGYSSTTSAHDLATMSVQDNKPLILFYIGDYDPSGMHMSEVDLPRRIEQYGGRASIQRIALTQTDVLTRGLPGFPTDDKTRDPRHPWYVKRYGTLFWELDALDPNILRDRVEQHIMSLIDRTIWERCDRVEMAERGSLLDMVNAWNAGAA